MPETIHFKYESATARLYMWDEQTATRSTLFSAKRRQGHATALMRAIVEYADKNFLLLTLEVGAFHYGDGLSPDNAGLVKFYEKFGFKLVGHITMERLPNSQNLHGS